MGFPKDKSEIDLVIIGFGGDGERFMQESSDHKNPCA